MLRLEYRPRRPGEWRIRTAKCSSDFNHSIRRTYQNPLSPKNDFNHIDVPFSFPFPLSLFSLTSAAPTPSAITDTDILNYALTLEHLENAFYAGGLAKFDQAAFDSAGLPEFTRGRFAQIAEHEASHVAYLEAALGDGAVKACEYSL